MSILGEGKENELPISRSSSDKFEGTEVTACVVLALVLTRVHRPLLFQQRLTRHNETKEDPILANRYEMSTFERIITWCMHLNDAFKGVHFIGMTNNLINLFIYKDTILAIPQQSINKTARY